MISDISAQAATPVSRISWLRHHQTSPHAGGAGWGTIKANIHTPMATARVPPKTFFHITSPTNCCNAATVETRDERHLNRV